jgi:hypothetical protein
VAPEVRCTKAHHVLGPRGALAVFWNLIVNRGDESLDRALNAAYAGLMLKTMWRSAPTDRVRANEGMLEELEASDLFGPATEIHEPWQATYDTDAWLELVSTASDHRMLDEDARMGLFDRIRSAVDENGGHVSVDYITVAYLAHARDPAGQQDPA